MRILLMVSNSNMAIRETYTTVVREQFPHWGLSFMSGLPPDASSIIRTYDLLIYELYRPDDAARYHAARALAEQMQEIASVQMVTHLTGPYRDGMATELEQLGVVVVAAPFSIEHIIEALKKADSLRSTARQDAAAASEADKPRRRLRDLFRRN